jgi:hypothetical protein
MDSQEIDQAIAAARAKYGHAEARYEPVVLDLIAAAESLREQVGEFRHLFDMQWKRMGEATNRWRAEDPAARELISPDLGALLEWLMNDADRARAGS